MENIGYTTELTSTERPTRWGGRQQLAEELTAKTQEWTQLWSQRDAGIHHLSWRWSVCACFKGHQVCWKTTALNITAVSTGPWKLFQWLCSTPCQKWAQLQRYLRTTPCVWSSKKQWGIFISTKSSFKGKGYFFFILLPSRNFEMFKCIAKKKKSDGNFIHMS